MTLAWDPPRFRLITRWRPLSSTLPHVLGKRPEPAIFPGATVAYSFQATAGNTIGDGFRSRLFPPWRTHPMNTWPPGEVYEASRIYALAALKCLTE